MSEHTDGPWYPVQYANWWNIQTTEEYSSANILDSEAWGEEEAEANAKLAASAPEMAQRITELEEELAELKKVEKKSLQVIDVNNEHITFIENSFRQKTFVANKRITELEKRDFDLTRLLHSVRNSLIFHIQQGLSASSARKGVSEIEELLGIESGKGNDDE